MASSFASNEGCKGGVEGLQTRKQLGEGGPVPLIGGPAHGHHPKPAMKNAKSAFCCKEHAKTFPGFQVAILKYFLILM